jgi:7,8-dihydroneopterin aldolase/epimerase/oxygenase
MGLIALEGMRFYAKHGFYDEEQVLGTWYVVDVQITTNFLEAVISDELAHTINYETVYEICRIAMEKPAKLLETIVKRIMAALKFQFQTIEDVTVSLKKENPPLGGQVACSRVDSTGLVALDGMRFYAKHGFYEEEEILGNWYMVDVQIKTNISTASASDELAHTINYETVYEICRIEMEMPAKLLETVVDRIMASLKHQFQSMEEVSVSLKKENPPIGGTVAHSRVENSENYADGCGRCGRPILCYGNTDCWCNSITVLPRTQEAIQQQYKKCLCKNCLAFYAN